MAHRRLLLALPGTARINETTETFMLNLYVMPIIGTGVKGDPRRPKYATTLSGFVWAMYDYGDEPHCLVGVVDISGAADSSLTANSDVTAIPQNLNTTIGSANVRNAVR